MNECQKSIVRHCSKESHWENLEADRPADNSQMSAFYLLPVTELSARVCKVQILCRQCCVSGRADTTQTARRHTADTEQTYRRHASRQCTVLSAVCLNALLWQMCLLTDCQTQARHCMQTHRRHVTDIDADSVVVA